MEPLFNIYCTHDYDINEVGIFIEHIHIVLASKFKGNNKVIISSAICNNCCCFFLDINVKRVKIKFYYSYGYSLIDNNVYGKNGVSNISKWIH